MKIVITGNPGTGKHTAARLIAARLKAEIVDINKIAIDGGAIADDTDKGLEVDLKKLAKLVTSAAKKKGNAVIVGHLAPYVLKTTDIDIAVVLRCSPIRLEETLKKRRYTRKKINENISAEIIGISLYDSVKTFGKRKVAEFDTTGKLPEQTIDEIIATLQKKRPRHLGMIDWLAVISEEEVQRFFAY